MVWSLETGDAVKNRTVDMRGGVDSDQNAGLRQTVRWAHTGKCADLSVQASNREESLVEGGDASVVRSVVPGKPGSRA